VATGLIPDIDAEYRQIREECALLRRDRSVISVRGPDAAEYLQGQITNDVEDLAPGSGRYALLLDRKGHIQADMRVLRLGEDGFQIDTAPGAGPGLLRHLKTYMIGRKVEVDEADPILISLLGPGSTAITGLAPGEEMDFTEAKIAGATCLVAVTDSGLDLFTEPDAAAAVTEQLIADGAVPVSEAAAEIVRVETGRPRLENEMSAGPMPAEAGLVERTVDFNKGCYIGQEPVARLHYRGRPNRFLRGLRLDGPAASGDAVRLGDRELGTIGTAVVSPASGRIGLAILRKEAEPGAEVSVATESGDVSATVVPLPFIGEELP
jgi:tRNA-modifying protein YgfZ